MTETTCPTCGAKCMVMQTRCTCNTPTCVHTERMYRALPQPDLTKLREMFEEWTHRHMKHDSRITDGIRVPIMSRKELDGLEYKLWCALKEVLDAEASNSSNNR